MSKLKLKFMLIVLKFIRDTYDHQPDLGRRGSFIQGRDHWDEDDLRRTIESVESKIEEE